MQRDKTSRKNHNFGSVGSVGSVGGSVGESVITGPTKTPLWKFYKSGDFTSLEGPKIQSGKKKNDMTLVLLVPV